MKPPTKTPTPQSLTATQAAVDRYRRLAAADTAGFQPVLAAALNNLSNRLAEHGRRPDSLTVIQDAPAIRRRLAAADPAAHKADLAVPPHNVSDRLAENSQLEGSAVESTRVVYDH